MRLFLICCQRKLDGGWEVAGSNPHENSLKWHCSKTLSVHNIWCFRIMGLLETENVFIVNSFSQDLWWKNGIYDKLMIFFLSLTTKQPHWVLMGFGLDLFWWSRPVFLFFHPILFGLVETDVCLPVGCLGCLSSCKAVRCGLNNRTACKWGSLYASKQTLSHL